MNKIHATIVYSLAMLVVVTASAMAQPSAHGVDVEKLLDSVPISLETYGTLHENYQFIDNIPRNLDMLYGVVCILEAPYDRKDGSISLLTFEHGYVPQIVKKDTTLREFLDTTCSDGKMVWAIVHNALHLWPAEGVKEKETYLDTVRMSLDLSGVSMLDAVKNWAMALNTNREPVGHGVGVRHSFSFVDTKSNHVTPPSMIAPGMVTVKLEDVTAREALCAILGASAQQNWITYMHLPTRSDVVRLHVTKEERISCEEITPEEREALNVQEDLESVLVEPAMAGEQR